MSEYRSLVKKDGDKYRVFYSYISPKDGKRHRTCKRGFKLRKDADKWAANELPALIRKLEQKQSDTEGMTMSELIEEYLEDARLDEEIEETTMATKNSCINNLVSSSLSVKFLFSAIRPYTKGVSIILILVICKCSNNSSPYQTNTH